MAIVRTNHAAAPAHGETPADVALEVPASLTPAARDSVRQATNSDDDAATIAPDTAATAPASEVDNPLHTQQFQRLLAGLTTHQAWAITHLYHTWAARAEALARSIIRNDESAACDVVQAAFMRVIQSPPKALPDAAAMDRWMARAVVSSAIDHLRREASQRCRIVVAASATSPNKAGNEANTESDIAEQITHLQSRLQALDVRDRELITLHHGRGMTLAAIAAALGQTLGSVHGRLRRAMEKIRRSEPQDSDGNVSEHRSHTTASLPEPPERIDR